MNKGIIFKILMLVTILLLVFACDSPLQFDPTANEDKSVSGVSQKPVRQSKVEGSQYVEGEIGPGGAVRHLLSR